MDNNNIWNKKNRYNKERKSINNNQNLWATLQIIIPLFLTIIYFKGFLIVLQFIHLDKLGEAGVILRMTYWSNIIILIWLTLGTSIFFILLIIHLVISNK